MKVLGKEKQRMCCGDIITGYWTIYLVNELPKERELIKVDDKVGYVVSLDYDEETKSNVVYLEKHLDDWNNQIAEICDTINLRVKEKQDREV